MSSFTRAYGFPELVTLSLGAVTLVVSFARSEDKPFCPSILIAYAFYLPINAGGFGLGSGVEGIWPQGLYVLLFTSALASVLGLITLLILKNSRQLPPALLQADSSCWCFI